MEHPLAFLLVDVEEKGEEVSYRAFRVARQQNTNPVQRQADMDSLIQVLRERGDIPSGAIVSHPIYLETNDNQLPIAPDGNWYILD